ncbi:DUF4244 domain-containing protein [Streptomyces sp. NPDC006798]|uniref:DUF4244 domain-containing protein n=1 Tax=Streptomyces sp. NPDC006798 TaxID=3155462 RepID=UPI0033DC396E
MKHVVRIGRALARFPFRPPILAPRLAAAGGDRGMTTAEYAMGTVAACGLAAVLYRVLTGDGVARRLESLIGEALNAPF